MRFRFMKKIENIAIIISGIAVVTFMSLPFSVFGKTSGPGSMTVDDCVSHTGMTTEQCEEMADKFKDMAPPVDDAKTIPSQNGQRQLPVSEVSSERPTPSARANNNTIATDNIEIEKISRLQVEKEQQLDQAKIRIAKIIEFLKSKEIEISETESAFEIFKAKTSAVSDAFNAYVQSLNNAKTDTSEAAETAVQDAKKQLKTVLSDLKDSYRILRIALDDAISKTNQ